MRHQPNGSGPGDTPWRPPKLNADEVASLARVITRLNEEADALEHGFLARVWQIEAESLWDLGIEAIEAA